MKNINDMINSAYELFENERYDASLEIIEETEKELLSASEKLFEGNEKNDILENLYNFRGFNYFGLSNTETAKKWFEKSLELNPNSSQANAGLGEVFYFEGNDDNAKIMFEWAVDGNPMNQFAISGLNKVNKRLGLDENHNTFNIDFSANRKDEYYKMLSEAYKLFTSKNYSESLDKLNEAEKLVDTGKDNFVKISNMENFKGYNFLALNDLESARQCFEQALSINQQSSQACCGLAEIFFLLGKIKESKIMYEWGVKHNHNNPFALEGLKKVNCEFGFSELHNSLFLV